MIITVVGAGYVGLASGLALAHAGHRVSFLETDSARIAALREGRDPIGEAHVGTLLAALRPPFTSDPTEALRGADAVLIAVGTPPSADGSADLSYLERAARTVSAASSPCTVFIRSTVPVGTADRLQAGILARFDVASNPEFLREGRAIADTMWPARIVGGGGAGAERTARALYDPILSGRFDPLPGEPPPGSTAELLWMDRRSAELAKYAANAFLATKLSLVNEIANVAAGVGADIRAVAKVMGSDPRIGSAFLRPGIGWGGSCFPKDTRALDAFARESGYEFTVLRAVIEQNNAQLLRFFELVRRSVPRRPEVRIGLLGLAFKAGTSDRRESPAVALAHLLCGEDWHVAAFDPRASAEGPDLPRDLQVVGTMEQAASGADALVVATEWPEFAAADYRGLASTMRGDVLLDGRCIVDPARARDAGLRYVGVCPPAPPAD